MPVRRLACWRGTSQLRPTGGSTAEMRRRAREYAYSSDTTSSDKPPSTRPLSDADASSADTRPLLTHFPRTTRPRRRHVCLRYALLRHAFARISPLLIRPPLPSLRRDASFDAASFYGAASYRFFTKRNSNIFVIKFQHFLSISIYNSFQIYLERSDS